MKKQGRSRKTPALLFDEEVQTQQDYQSAERQIEFRTELEIPEQQDGNQCCPNLC